MVLALLAVEPATGYDLAYKSNISVEPLWSATHSQIYPTLHKLRREKLVRAERSQRGRQRATVYHITDMGLEELAAWKARPVQYLPYRDPFRLWASFLDEAPPDAVFRNIDEHIRREGERAEYLEGLARDVLEGDHPLVESRVGRVSEQALERIRRARGMVHRELAALARFEVESALRIRELACELHPRDDE